jgi:radical SAM superfamily enzyme YgiQ (UPF0313 family)
MSPRPLTLLIHPPQGEENSAPPLGLAWLAAALLRAGWPTLLVDLQFGDSVPREWLERATLVGIGFMTPQAPAAYAIGRELRAAGKRVVMGGPHVTVLPGEAFEEGAADLVALGEGEETVVELVAALAGGRAADDVPGLALPDGDGFRLTPSRALIEDLDALPFPARQYLPMRRYRLGYLGFDPAAPVASIISSRGCYGRCTFCCSHNVFGRKIRWRSAENIVAEVEEISQRHRLRQFNFSDDTFTLNTANVLEFCRLLTEGRYGIRWACSTRVNNLTEEMLVAMRESGCIRLGLGLESGSQEILDRIRKGTTVEQNRRALELIGRAGLTAYGYFMVGNPGENASTLRQTEEFIRSTGVTASFSFATPYPGTDFHEEARAAGWLRELPWNEYVTTGRGPVSRTADLDHDELAAAKRHLETVAAGVRSL